MEIEQTKNSKIDTIDFEKLTFGEIFTDHMFVCDYRDGEWQEPQIMPYQSLQLDPSCSVFHYGQAVFEGMKAYKDDDGKVWLFRPDENQKRINRSSERLAIPEFPAEYFHQGLHQLLALDAEWIKPGIGNSLYIRPVVFASQPGVSANKSNQYKFLIICAPVKAYYSGEVNVLVAEKYSRAASGGVGFAKAAGNYAASFYPAELARKEGYQQIVWTDANTHEYLEEAGTMNIFVRIGDTLITAPTTDTILDGITRKSIIQLAKDMGISIEIRPIKIDEIIQAHQTGELKELFGAGTAVVVNKINSIGYKGKRYNLPVTTDGYADVLKEKILHIQYNIEADPHGWTTEVKLS